MLILEILPLVDLQSSFWAEAAAAAAGGAAEAARRKSRTKNESRNRDGNGCEEPCRWGRQQLSLPAAPPPLLLLLLFARRRRRLLSLMVNDGSRNRQNEDCSV